MFGLGHCWVSIIVCVGDVDFCWIGAMFIGVVSDASGGGGRPMVFGAIPFDETVCSVSCE